MHISRTFIPEGSLSHTYCVIAALSRVYTCMQAFTSSSREKPERLLYRANLANKSLSNYTEMDSLCIAQIHTPRLSCYSCTRVPASLRFSVLQLMVTSAPTFFANSSLPSTMSVARLQEEMVVVV